MRKLRNAACAVLAGSLAAVAAPSLSAPSLSGAASPNPRGGDFCAVILQGKPVATFAEIRASSASAAGRRVRGSLILKGGASRGDRALQQWLKGSQRGEHQEVEVACSRAGCAAQTYALHNAWASRIAYASKAHGQTRVRLTIRYERLTVKLRMS
jgi:hypothetical protein